VVTMVWVVSGFRLNPLKAELNPICHLLTLLGAATIVAVSRLRVKVETSSTRSQNFNQ
jgi:hypothetical protein